MIKDRDVLLQFYDHHRTIQIAGSVANPAIATALKLFAFAQGSWRRLDATAFLLKVVYSIKFKDGIQGQALLGHGYSLAAALDLSGEHPESARGIALSTVNS